MPTPKPECMECGARVNGRRSVALFCSDGCRRAFNNRRMVRGAEMYDLVMAWRFERGRADPMDIRGLLGRLAGGYRISDKVRRAGRKSWIMDKAIARVPLTFSTNEGDGR